MPHNILTKKVLFMETEIQEEQGRYTYWKWRVLVSTMLCYMFFYCGRFGLSICMKPIMNEFGWSKSTMGMMVSALIISYGIGQFINGGLADRFGRILMPIGAVTSCALNWLFSFSPDIAPGIATLLGITNISSVIFATMAVVFACNGYFQAMGMAPGGRLISNWWVHSERGKAMGFYTFAAGMSNVTVFLLATLCADRWGWRAAFRYPTLLMAVVAVAFYFMTKDKPEDAGLKSRQEGTGKKRGSSIEQYVECLKNRNFVLASFSIAFHHVIRWGLLSFIPVFFIEVVGWKIKGAGFVSAALPLGMAFGALTGGYISDKFFGGKRANVIAVSLLLCSICVFIMPVLASYTVSHPETGKIFSVAMLIVSGFMLYGPIAPYFALPADLLGTQNSGTGIGIMNAVAYGGAAVGTAIIGVICDNYGWNAAFIYMACCGLVALILIKLIREDKDKQNQPQRVT